MSDYIKREDAEKLFDEYRPMMAIKTCEYGIELKKIPSADVAPVRHGRWIVGDSLPMHDIAGNLSWGNWYTCNQCEFKTYAIERHITQYNYCPNCGARMDGEE